MTLLIVLLLVIFLQIPALRKEWFSDQNLKEVHLGFYVLLRVHLATVSTSSLVCRQATGNQCHPPHRLLYTTIHFTLPYSALHYSTLHCSKLQFTLNFPTVHSAVHYTEYLPKGHCSITDNELQCNLHYSAQCTVVHRTLNYSALKCSVVCSTIRCTPSYSAQCVKCCTSSPALHTLHSTHHTA